MCKQNAFLVLLISFVDFNFEGVIKVPLLKLQCTPIVSVSLRDLRVILSTYSVTRFKISKQSHAIVSGKFIQTLMHFGFLKDHFDNTILIASVVNGLKRAIVNGVL